MSDQESSLSGSVQIDSHLVCGSARWCDCCQKWDDHHSDRCARLVPHPDRVRGTYNLSCEVWYG